MKFSLKYPNYKELGIGITTLTLFQIACAITVIVQSIDFIRIKSVVDIPNVSYLQLYLELVICIFLLLSSILILYKKKIGVTIYTAMSLLSLIINIIFNGFNLNNLLTSFLSSIVLLLFIYRKRHLYFN